MTDQVKVVPVTAEEAFVLRVSGVLNSGTAETALGKLSDATAVLPRRRWWFWT